MHVGVEPYATFKVRKTELFLTMPHPRADLWQMPHRGEVEVNKCPTNARGGDGPTWNCRAITRHVFACHKFVQHTLVQRFRLPLCFLLRVLALQMSAYSSPEDL